MYKGDPERGRRMEKKTQQQIFEEALAKSFSKLVKNINIDTLILNYRTWMNISKGKYKVHYIGHILVKQLKTKETLEQPEEKYLKSHMPHNDVLVNYGPHIWPIRKCHKLWSRNIPIA